MPEVNQSVISQSRFKRYLAAVAASMIVAGVIMSSAPAFADGTEMLDTPLVPIAEGSGVVGAGVGLSLTQPGDIAVEIPAGATVKQVLIYWDGEDKQYNNGPAPTIGSTTDMIKVSNNGGVDVFDVRGVFIGGRTFKSGVVQHFAFRADITSLGLVAPGSNTLTVSGLDFGQNPDGNPGSHATGAGVLVIIDDGTSSTIGIFDGNDYAYVTCNEPGDESLCRFTVKKMFTFPAASSARDADLTMFFTSVEGEVSGGGSRPSVVRVWAGAAPAIELIDQLSSNDGEEWDTLNVEFEVPAGVTSVEVQAFSEDINNDPNKNPASFKWLTAGLSVPNEERGGGQGCTPGYWKQPHHFADWTSPYDPDDMFSDHFEDAFPGQTLVEVADGNGGGLIALGRHTVAALLNAANPEVSYDYTAQEVIDAFNDVYPGSKNDYEALKDDFEAFNVQGCPLNNSDGSNGSGGNGNGNNNSNSNNSNNNNNRNQSGANSPTSLSVTGADEPTDSLSGQSSGGAFGFLGVLALLAAGFGGIIRERRAQ